MKASDPILEPGMGPECFCGHRDTVRVGYSENPEEWRPGSALLRRCSCNETRRNKNSNGELCTCTKTRAYRLYEGVLIPFAQETALALDEYRRKWRSPEMTAALLGNDIDQLKDELRLTRKDAPPIPERPTDSTSRQTLRLSLVQTTEAAHANHRS